MTTTAEFIAGFEGYAGRAYWDVNAYRLGYGSDTEGPDQIPVTEGMETTKARALQNLALRIPQFQEEAVHGKTGMGRDIRGKNSPTISAPRSRRLSTITGDCLSSSRQVIQPRPLPQSVRCKTPMAG
jgi:hypothetical protein